MPLVPMMKLKGVLDVVRLVANRCRCAACGRSPYDLTVSVVVDGGYAVDLWCECKRAEFRLDDYDVRTASLGWNMEALYRKITNGFEMAGYRFGPPSPPAAKKPSPAISEIHTAKPNPVILSIENKPEIPMAAEVDPAVKRFSLLEIDDKPPSLPEDDDHATKRFAHLEIDE